MAAIVRRFQAGGDREAEFRRLFDLYYAAVRAFFANRGFGPEDCADLTQDTLLRVWDGLAAYRCEAPFGIWLFRIAANVWRHRLRHDRTHKRSGQTLPLDEIADPPAPRADGGATAELLRREAIAALQVAVAELPPQQRRCVQLRLTQDLDYGQIATVLRLSPDTVRAHMFHARARLRERLGQDLGPGWDL